MDHYYSNKKPDETLEMNIIEVVKSSAGRISVPIQKTICVFYESSSTVILKYKNKEITKFTTFNDYYGDSIDSAIEEALALEKAYDIDKKSGLVIVIETEYIKRFGVPATEKNRYYYVPSGWFIDNESTKKLISLIEKKDQTSEDYDTILKIREEVDFETKNLKIVQTWDSLTKVKKTK